MLEAGYELITYTAGVMNELTTRILLLWVSRLLYILELDTRLCLVCSALGQSTCSVAELFLSARACSVPRPEHVTELPAGILRVLRNTEV